MTIKDLVEKHKNDKSFLVSLKGLLIESQELSNAEIVHKALLDLSKEYSKINPDKEEVEFLSLLFNMVGLNISHPAIYKIKKCLEIYKEKGQDIGIKDTSKIQADCQAFYEWDF